MVPLELIAVRSFLRTQLLLTASLRAMLASEAFPTSVAVHLDGMSTLRIFGHYCDPLVL